MVTRVLTVIVLMLSFYVLAMKVLDARAPDYYREVSAKRIRK